MNKKAISPVIAISLLVIVSVVAVIGFQSWYGSYSSKTFADVETKDKSQGITIEYITSEGIMYVKNHNGANITLNDVEISGLDCNINQDIEPGITNISIYSCLNNTGTNEVVIITDSEIVEKKIFIKNIEKNMTIPQVETTCINITNDLVGLWHLNANLLDSSNNNFHGTNVGGAISVAGILNESYTFNGNQYIYAPIGQVNGNITYLFWFNANDLVEIRRIIARTWTGGSFTTHHDLSNNFYGGFQDASAGQHFLNMGNINPNTWYFAAFTYNTNGTIRGYLNNVTQKSGFTPSLKVDSNHLYIGSLFDPGKKFEGEIDEVAVYNDVLSFTQIKQIYEGGIQGKPICDP